MADEVLALPVTAISKIVLFNEDGTSTEVAISDLNRVEITADAVINDTTANAEVETMADDKVDVEALRKELLGEVAKAIETLKAEAAAKTAEAEKLRAEKAKLEKEVEELNKAGPRGAVSGAPTKGWEALSKKEKVETLRKTFGKGELMVYGIKKLRNQVNGEWSENGPVV